MYICVMHLYMNMYTCISARSHSVLVLVVVVVVVVVVASYTIANIFYYTIANVMSCLVY